MPSIRKLVLDKGVSCFTAVQAYERPVAQGDLDPRLFAFLSRYVSKS